MNQQIESYMRVSYETTAETGPSITTTYVFTFIPFDKGEKLCIVQSSYLHILSNVIMLIVRSW